MDQSKASQSPTTEDPRKQKAPVAVAAAPESLLGATAARARSSGPGFAGARVMRRNATALQRLAGNRAVSDVVAAARVQRHPEGAELPDKEEDVGEIQEKQQAAPKRRARKPRKQPRWPPPRKRARTFRRRKS